MVDDHGQHANYPVHGEWGTADGDDGMLGCSRLLAYIVHRGSWYTDSLDSLTLNLQDGILFDHDHQGMASESETRVRI